MRYINSISGKEVKASEVRDIVKACISRYDYMDRIDDEYEPIRLNREAYGYASVIAIIRPDVMTEMYDRYLDQVAKDILEGNENEDVMINIVE